MYLYLSIPANDNQKSYNSEFWRQSEVQIIQRSLVFKKWHLSFLNFHHSFHVEREKQESYMYKAKCHSYLLLHTYIADRFSKLLSMSFDLRKSKRCISVKKQWWARLPGFLGKFGSLVNVILGGVWMWFSSINADIISV